jgi:hypothetical protein
MLRMDALEGTFTTFFKKVIIHVFKTLGAQINSEIVFSSTSCQRHPIFKCVCVDPYFDECILQYHLYAVILYQYNTSCSEESVTECMDNIRQWQSLSHYVVYFVNPKIGVCQHLGGGMMKCSQHPEKIILYLRCPRDKKVGVCCIMHPLL